MNPVAEKQLEIILKLNRLTKRGKIVWEKHPLKSDHLHFFANYKGKTFVLTNQPNLIGLLYPEITIHLGREFSLSIKGAEDEQPIHIGPMPALDDLARTIQLQQTLHELNDVAKRSNEHIKDLEDVERLLDEDLSSSQ